MKISDLPVISSETAKNKADLISDRYDLDIQVSPLPSFQNESDGMNNTWMVTQNTNCHEGTFHGCGVTIF